MPEQGEDLIIVGISDWKLSRKNLLEKVEAISKSYPGKPLLIALPEGVFGGRAMERARSKEIVNRIHEILGRHGNAHAFLSIIEKGRLARHGQPPKEFITNTGYLVLPKKTEKGIGYRAYPKLATYKEGRELTDYDADVAHKNNNTMGGTAEVISKIGKKIKKFPETEIHGMAVSMRVCADSRLGPDPHPARSKGRPDIMIIPAKNLGLDPEDVSYIRKSMSKNGVAIILDGGAYNRTEIIHSAGGHVLQKPGWGRNSEAQVVGPKGRKIRIVHVK